MSAIQEAIRSLSENNPIDVVLCEQVAREILGGEATSAQIGAFLLGMRMIGETPEQLGAFARIMQDFATPIELANPEGLIDIVGTGGDGSGTFNISTATAIVVAGTGVRLAKHGNRAVTGATGSGSADVLAELGIKIDCSPETNAACLDAAGLAFFFAPAYHSAMRHCGPARREIGVRTIMNLLGPLANPVRVKRQLLGVGAPELTEIFGDVQSFMGMEHVMVVHGCDGMDEISLTGPSKVTEYKDGQVKRWELDPTDYGLSLCTVDELKPEGEGAEPRAAVIRAILNGQGGPKRDITLLNAAAGLVVAGEAESIKEGLELAAESIDTGTAAKVLATMVKVTNSEKDEV